ncbi:MAG: hypothetical protein V1712_01930 [Patescibacteria group bacterium]
MLENINRPKLFILILFVIGIALIAFIFYLVFKTEPEELPLENENYPTGVLPPIGPGNVNVAPGGPTTLPHGTTRPGAEPTKPGTKPSAIASGGETSARAVTKTPVKAPLAVANSTRFYNPLDGKFYEITPDGVQKSLSDDAYVNAKNITWSPNGNSAILEFPDGANIVYDFNQKKQYTLPKEMTEFSFSPTSDQIAGKFLSEENKSDNWLVAINSDGSGLQGIEPMGDNADKVEVAWSPSSQVVALSRTGEPSGLFSQEVLLIGRNGENFKSLQVDGRGFDGRWTPKDGRLLYSVYSDRTDYLPGLWLVEASPERVGYNKKEIGLATWVDKCTMAAGTNVAYCAVPQNLPTGAGYVRELAQGLPDVIYRVDLTNGNSSIVASPVDDRGSGVATSNLTLSSDGKFLYFIDEATSQLRSLQLNP